MIELVEGFWVDPFQVTVVKSISENKCSLWVYGQSATEGFVLDYPAEEVVQAIIDARVEDEEESDSEEETEEE